jgi:ribosome-binding protein aMBF1 (putative translation factor)
MVYGLFSNARPTRFFDPDIDDGESGPEPIPRRRRAPVLRHDGLAMVVAGAVRVETARRGLSQQDLAMALGMSRTAVSARFTAQVPWTLDEVGRLSELFGCHLRDLMTESPGRSPW